jgi:transcriptional regulator with XRE-family HTH domain
MMAVMTETDDTNGPVIGRRIHDVRQRLHWSQERLARQARVTRNFIASLESGNTGDPGAARLQRVARALGVPIDYLISGRVDSASATAEAELSALYAELTRAERVLARVFLQVPGNRRREIAAPEEGDSAEHDSPDAEAEGR